MNGSVVATQGMLPIRLQIGNKSVLTGKSESTLIQTAYRGTGTMKDLYEYAIGQCTTKNMELIWGFTAAVKAFKDYGFSIFPDIQLLTRTGALTSGLKRRFRLNAPMHLRIGSAVKFITRYIQDNIHDSFAYKEIPCEFYLNKGPCEEHDLMALYEKLYRKYPDSITLIYNKEYLDWRVRSNPFIQYKEFQAYNGKEMHAYAIVTESDKILTISDLTSQNTHAALFLLNNIIKEHQNGAGDYRFLVNPKDSLSRDLIGHLASFGFKNSQRWNLVVRDLSNGMYPQLFNISNWHINGLWTEGASM